MMSSAQLDKRNINLHPRIDCCHKTEYRRRVWTAGVTAQDAAAESRNGLDAHATGYT